MNNAWIRFVGVVVATVGAVAALAGPHIHKEDWIRRVNFYNYTKIIVVPMETASAELPRSAGKNADVAKVLAESTDHFVRGLTARSSDSIRERIKVTASPGRPRGAVVIRTRLLSLDPGSRFRRAWTERGGNTRVVVEGEVLDAASGEVLLRFAYSHESGFAHADKDDERGGSDYPLLVNDLGVVGGFLGDVLRGNEWTW